MEVSAVVVNSDDAFLHIANASVGIDWLTGLDLRRPGTRLGKEALRAIGLRANAIATEEYLACLNEAGQSNPMASADTLAHTINVSRSSWADITRHARQRGDQHPIWFWPSNMQAGPCQKAMLIGECAISVQDAMLLPMPGCSHPDQCWCSYRQMPRTRTASVEVGGIDLRDLGIEIVIRGR
jgi:hypothetical protein